MSEQEGRGGAWTEERGTSARPAATGGQAKQGGACRRSGGKRETQHGRVRRGAVAVLPVSAPLPAFRPGVP